MTWGRKNQNSLAQQQRQRRRTVWFSKDSNGSKHSGWTFKHKGDRKEIRRNAVLINRERIKQIGKEVSEQRGAESSGVANEAKD